MLKKCFKIDNSIYSEDIINSVIEVFKDISEISYDEDKLCINVDSEEEAKETFLEFMNYYIWVYNELV